MLTGGRVLAATALFVLVACARIEPPPGGPPDKKPPMLVKITPDSLAIIPDFKGNVEFIFDEVVSEGGQPSMGYGNSDLERLVLLSPTDKVPVVQWQRSRIGVRPREGWQPNRVYRVQLLPGVSDIRNNKGVAGGIVTFTTGAPVPDYTIHGRAFDWSMGQPLRGGLVSAILEPDSLAYRVLTDSSGSYVLGPIPRGTYLVYAGIDLNHNGKLDTRDAFDSVRVTPDSGQIPEIWAFLHDTTPPRLSPPTVQDSMTIALTFAQKLDPTQSYDTNSVKVVQLPDSTPIRVLAVMTQATYDSASRVTRAHADSLARQARPDTLHNAGKAEPAQGREADSLQKPGKADSLGKAAKPVQPAPPAPPDTGKHVPRPGIRPAGPDSLIPGRGAARTDGGAEAVATAAQRQAHRRARYAADPGHALPRGSLQREERHGDLRFTQGGLRGPQASQGVAGRQRATAADQDRLRHRTRRLDAGGFTAQADAADRYHEKGRGRLDKEGWI